MFNSENEEYFYYSVVLRQHGDKLWKKAIDTDIQEYKTDREYEKTKGANMKKVLSRKSIGLQSKAIILKSQAESCFDAADLFDKIMDKEDI